MRPCMPYPAQYDPTLTACRLAAQALGLSPVGAAWPHTDPGLCALDASAIAHGDPYLPWKAGENFMDQQSTVASPVISGYAAPFLTKTVMQKTQRMVFCREGAFSLGTDAARTWFFLTPPEPPFVAVISSSMLQHLIWRTPICWSQDAVVFRHGPDLLQVRRPRLLEAVAVLREYAATHDPKDRPFLCLDRDRDDVRHGRLKRDLDPRVRTQLLDLTPGELMALATLCKRHPEAPHRPDPLLLGVPA